MPYDVDYPSAGDNLALFVAGLAQHRSSEWAREHYKSTILDLISVLAAKTVIEIGGGRRPLLRGDEIRAKNVRYIVNDISARELELAPAELEKVCFNISQQTIDCADLEGKIELMFSNMVFEHVADSQQAYVNIFKLLAPGGVCLNFHPVLYSPPFVANWLLPENVSAPILRYFFPYRNPDQSPKHPAKYDHCKINEYERQRLLSIGYRRVWQIPFWYHKYFNRIPGLYHLDRAANRWAERKNWCALASYCYTVVVK